MKAKLVNYMKEIDNRTKLKDMKYMIPGSVSLRPLKCLTAIIVGFIMALVIFIFGLGFVSYLIK